MSGAAETNGTSGEVANLTAASWGWRTAARWLDTLVQSFVAFAGTLATANIAQHARGPGSQVAIAAVVIGTGAVLLLYEPFLVATRSRTWGMASMRVRVADCRTGGAPSPARSAVRFAVASAPGAALVVALVVDRLTWYVYWIPGRYWIPRLHWEPAVFLWWALGAVVWWLVVRCSAFLDTERRGWHDKAAGTVVVAAASASSADTAADVAAEPIAIGPVADASHDPTLEQRQSAPPPDRMPATSASRLRAWLIDAISAAVVLMAGLFAWAAAVAVDVGLFCGGGGFWPECDPAGPLSALGFAAFACAAVTVALFGVVPVARGRQTPGMRAAAIRVVAYRSGGPAGYGRAVVRWLAPGAAWVVGFAAVVGSPWWRAAGDPPPWWWISSFAAWGLVRLSGLWDAERRGWHDKAAETIVIEASQSE